MVVLVAARWEGTQNILVAGWQSVISMDSPIMSVAVGLERNTHHMIQRSGVYGAHFLPAERARTMRWARPAGWKWTGLPPIDRAIPRV